MKTTERFSPLPEFSFPRLPRPSRLRDDADIVASLALGCVCSCVLGLESAFLVGFHRGGRRRGNRVPRYLPTTSVHGPSFTTPCRSFEPYDVKKARRVCREKCLFLHSILTRYRSEFNLRLSTFPDVWVCFLAQGPMPGQAHCMPPIEICLSPLRLVFGGPQQLAGLPPLGSFARLTHHPISDFDKSRNFSLEKALTQHP